MVPAMNLEVRRALKRPLGFSSNLVEHIMKALQPDVVTRFSLGDVFAAGGADKLAWASGWRELPHISPEGRRQYAYPQQFAEEMFGRIERALHGKVAGGAGNAVTHGGPVHG